MDLQSRVAHIIEALKLAYPEALCALHSQKDYELMIAVRLSAQCTDERVNLVTPALFAEFPTLESFACADVARVEELVHSCGFYKHKARDIVPARRPICFWATSMPCRARWSVIPIASASRASSASPTAPRIPPRPSSSSEPCSRR